MRRRLVRWKSTQQLFSFCAQSAVSAHGKKITEYRKSVRLRLLFIFYIFISSMCMRLEGCFPCYVVFCSMKLLVAAYKTPKKKHFSSIWQLRACFSGKIVNRLMLNSRTICGIVKMRRKPFSVQCILIVWLEKSKHVLWHMRNFSPPSEFWRWFNRNPANLSWMQGKKNGQWNQMFGKFMVHDIGACISKYWNEFETASIPIINQLISKWFFFPSVQSRYGE